MVASQKCELAQNCVKIWTYRPSSSRSSKVIDFSRPTNRKRIYDFLLVINSNHGPMTPILHRFWGTATYWLKIAYFSYRSFIQRPHSLCSRWNFGVKLTTRKLRVMELLCGESCMILTSTVFDWFTRVTDRQTDGHTDGRAIAYMRYSICYIQGGPIKTVHFWNTIFLQPLQI